MGLTLVPFSGKHLQPPLQSLPPQGPLCFFPPCQTQNRQHAGQRCDVRGHIYTENFNNHLHRPRRRVRPCVAWLSPLCTTRDTVWGKPLCTVGVTNCVCLQRDLWIQLLFIRAALLHECGWLLQRCMRGRVNWSGVHRGCLGCSSDDSLWTSRHKGQPWKCYSSEMLGPGHWQGHNLSFGCLHTNTTTHHHRLICARNDTTTHTAHGVSVDVAWSKKAVKRDFPTRGSEVSRSWASWDSRRRQLRLNGLLENFCFYAGF